MNNETRPTLKFLGAVGTVTAIAPRRSSPVALHLAAMRWVVEREGSYLVWGATCARARPPLS
jgi:hypothetical protein